MHYTINIGMIQYEALKETAKTLSTGEKTLKKLEAAEKVIGESAEEIVRNRYDAKEVAVDDRVRSMQSSLQDETVRHVLAERQLREQLEAAEEQQRQLNNMNQLLVRQNAEIQEQLDQQKSKATRYERKAEEFDLICQEYPEAVMLVGKDRYVCRTEEREQEYMEFDPEDFEFRPGSRMDPGEEYVYDYDEDDYIVEPSRSRSRDDEWER